MHFLRHGASRKFWIKCTRGSFEFHFLGTTGTESFLRRVINELGDNNCRAFIVAHDVNGLREQGGRKRRAICDEISLGKTPEGKAKPFGTALLFPNASSRKFNEVFF